MPHFNTSFTFFSGVFELAVIRMSRYFDISQNAVLFQDIMLPMEAFLSTRDTVEMKLVTHIFEFAKELAEMQLSEVALALYSAYILLQDGKEKILAHSQRLQERLPYCLVLMFCFFFLFSDRNGLRNHDEIRKLNQAVLHSLNRELTHRPPMVLLKGDVSILDKLLSKRHVLRY